ncbi:hypothetical protein [Stenoxybacter acetivorans]|uniref:hypothetical protein n=1 Tax=Stenoxybacter acetivorans TaxID=422441 RepID=UPI001B80033A|nr:hypothetical protein [Stenoxybacter acetivorans]
MHLSTLQSEYRNRRDAFSESFRLRIHCALSWLKKAEQEADVDFDICFISLWIAFNSAYAKRLPELSFSQPDHHVLRAFLQQVCALDTDNSLYRLV